jgi:hypothetical protein
MVGLPRRCSPTPTLPTRGPPSVPPRSLGGRPNCRNASETANGRDRRSTGPSSVPGRSLDGRLPSGGPHASAPPGAPVTRARRRRPRSDRTPAAPPALVESPVQATDPHLPATYTPPVSARVSCCRGAGRADGCPVLFRVIGAHAATVSRGGRLPVAGASLEGGHSGESAIVRANGRERPWFGRCWVAGRSPGDLIGTPVRSGFETACQRR